MTDPCTAGLWDIQPDRACPVCGALPDTVCESANVHTRPLAAALAFAAQIDRAAALDEALEWPQHEDLYTQIGDLAGGLGYDIKTRVDQTLTDILPLHCEAAAQKVADENPDELWHGLGGNDPDAGMSGWLEDAMADAHDAAAQAWLVEARKLAGPMLEVQAEQRMAA